MSMTVCQFYSKKISELKWNTFQRSYLFKYQSLFQKRVDKLYKSTEIKKAAIFTVSFISKDLEKISV